MRIDKAQQKLIGAAAVIAALHIGLVIWPVYKQTRSLNSQAAGVEAELSGSRGQAAELTALSRDVKRIAAEMADGVKKVPQEGEMAQMIRELSNRLAAQHLSDPTIGTQTTLPGPNYNTVPIIVGFHGDGVSAFRFINDVESLPRVVQVKRIHLLRSEKLPGQVEAEIELNTFYSPAPEPAQ
jgi:Tfp pilus assembly protein PilO